MQAGRVHDQPAAQGHRLGAADLELDAALQHAAVQHGAVQGQHRTFRLGVGKKVIEAKPGDVIWIPEKTPIVYMGDKAVVCYALHPVDWRKRHGLA